MAETDHDTVAAQLRPTRFLIAATFATLALVAATTLEITLGGLGVFAVLHGLLRATCAVLWICYALARFIERFVDPNTVAYCAGYCDGVARRFPGHERDDKVTFIDR